MRPARASHAASSFAAMDLQAAVTSSAVCVSSTSSGKSIAAAIAAVVGAAVLVCRILSKRSGDGSCPCKRLVSRFFPKPDPDAADFAD